jgi:hypothetical protein
MLLSHYRYLTSFWHKRHNVEVIRNVPVKDEDGFLYFFQFVQPSIWWMLANTCVGVVNGGCEIPLTEMLQLDETGGNNRLVMQTVQGLVLQLDNDFQLWATKTWGSNNNCLVKYRNVLWDVMYLYWRKQYRWWGEFFLPGCESFSNLRYRSPFLKLQQFIEGNFYHRYRTIFERLLKQLSH